MKELNIKRLNLTSVDTKDIQEVFQQQLVTYNSIDQVNWGKEYPYKPIVRFAIAHNNESILLHFNVEEENTEATRTDDGSDVWNDSCIEFFIKFGENAPYYNIEVNCIGTCLVSIGEEKNDRKCLPLDTISQIKRWSSLGNKPFWSQKKLCKWDLCLSIPKETFIYSDIEKLSGIDAYGNFYKCGDELATPHFLSWNKISSSSPNFHLPEYFGKIKFE